MLLALDEGLAGVAAARAVGVDVAAVEEDVVAGGRGAGEVGDEGVAGVVDSVGDLKDGAVVPVGEDHRSKILVVVGGCGTLDHNGSEDTVSIL